MNHYDIWFFIIVVTVDHLTLSSYTPPPSHLIGALILILFHILGSRGQVRIHQGVCNRCPNPY